MVGPDMNRPVPCLLRVSKTEQEATMSETATTTRKRGNVVALPVQTTIVVARISRDKWVVRQNGEALRSESGAVRKFSTERRAMLAAQRAAGITVVDERDRTDSIVAKLAQATPEQLAAVTAALS
jgi:hypothetical protein